MFRVMGQVDLKVLDDQISDVWTDVMGFESMCLKIECANGRVNESSLLKARVQNLKHDLKSIFAIMGSSNKNRRGLNAIGSGLKWLFGTMDNDDKVEINNMIQGLGERQDQLHEVVRDTFHLMKNYSTQWGLLKKNQQIQRENLLALRKEIMERFADGNSEKASLDRERVKSHIENFCTSLEIQINKLRNSILFLKSGVLDPHLIDPEEFASLLSVSQLGYNISFADLETVFRYTRSFAVFEARKKIIHIGFHIPMAKGEEYSVYENLIPKLVNSSAIVLDKVRRYIAFSQNNSNYVDMDTLDCMWVSNLCISKGLIKFSVVENGSCLTNVFLKNNDRGCQYRELVTGFQISNPINNGLILFSSVNVSIQLICPFYDETKTINGIYYDP